MSVVKYIYINVIRPKIWNLSWWTKLRRRPSDPPKKKKKQREIPGGGKKPIEKLSKEAIGKREGEPEPRYKASGVSGPAGWPGIGFGKNTVENFTYP